MVASMATPLSDILTELDQFLEPDRFEDYCPNGLQVPPPGPLKETAVETIATGVTPAARSEGAI